MPPNERLGYAENFLYMLDAHGSTSYRPNPAYARAMEVGVLVLLVFCSYSSCSPPSSIGLRFDAIEQCVLSDQLGALLQRPE
jgi:hypothetical protein